MHGNFPWLLKETIGLEDDCLVGQSPIRDQNAVSAAREMDPGIEAYVFKARREPRFRERTRLDREPRDFFFFVSATVVGLISSIIERNQSNQASGV